MKNYGSSFNYFIKAQNYDELSQMIIDWANDGYKGERDLFITKSVLMFNFIY